jgi:ubiquinone/menaquinone biosynthesis C-methylase UbiE
MCVACDTRLNAEQMEAFGARFIEALNHGALIMMMSLGHRAGLFDAMRGAGPLSSDALAERAGLSERYVREWLGAMVCGGIVNCDTAGKTFELPAAHAAMLTDDGGGENLAHLTQYVSMMGYIEDKLLHCFRHGGGVGYAEFPRFHELMERDSKQSIVDHLFQDVLPLVPEVIDAMRDGIHVLDIGCGRGRALLAMAQEFPSSQFTGYDLSAEAVDYAQARARELGLSNVRFVQRDLTDFDQTAEAAAFDFVTAFDAIHDQARPDRVLAGIRRTVAAGGTFLMQDIGASSNVHENRKHPIGTLLYGMSCSHCMTVSLAQGGLGVGAVWGEQMTREFLANAGFSRIERHTLSHDIQNYYYIVRP